MEVSCFRNSPILTQHLLIVYLVALQLQPPLPHLLTPSANITINVVTMQRDAAFLVHGAIKQAGRSLAVISIAGPSHLGHLWLYEHDHYSNAQFLIDTGAEVSIILPSCTDSQHPHDSFSFQAVNYSYVTIFGVWSRTLNLRFHCTLCGFHHYKHRTSHLGCRLPATVWPRCRFISLFPTQLYTSMSIVSCPVNPPWLDSHAFSGIQRTPSSAS